LKKVILIISIPVALSSCAKKYDWTCTCQYYTQTGTETKTKPISHEIKSDADRECAKFGQDNDPNGANGARDCAVN